MLATPAISVAKNLGYSASVMFDRICDYGGSRGQSRSVFPIRYNLHKEQDRLRVAAVGTTGGIQESLKPLLQLFNLADRVM
jgi:hypothetical protein